MLQQTKLSQRPASSPSRPGAEGTQGSGSHRGLQPRGPAMRQRPECRKPLLTPRFDRRWGQDRGGSCVQEEGGEEYAAYHNPQAEREASFGPGVGVAVVANGTGRIEDAVVRSPLESEEGGSKEVPPSERCGAESNAGVASGGAHRVYVQGAQCRKHKPSWYKNHYYARVRDSNGDWHKLFDTYCGIVGGAALTPGVDVFGAPGRGGMCRVRRLQGSRNDH